MQNYLDIKNKKLRSVGDLSRLLILVMSAKTYLFRANALCLLLLVAANVSASNRDERRLQISLSMFPRILAVDNQYFERISGLNKKSCLAFIYQTDLSATRKLGEKLKESVKNIAGLTFDTIVVDVGKKMSNLPEFTSALFLAERLEDEAFGKALQYAQNHHLILFSPFKGDVERGATAGIAFSNLAKPYFNVETLTRSAIEINQMLIETSVVYEPNAREKK